MAAPTQPNNIPRAWASGTNKFNAIPDTTATAGAASWSAGFPESCTKPLNQGGTLPHWLDMQGVLNALSAHVVYQQAGGQYVWSNSVDYPVGALVLASDGDVYLAQAASGPSTAAVNPTTEGQETWTKMITAEGLAGILADYVKATALATTLTSYLLKSGGTMTGGITFTDGDALKLSTLTQTMLLVGGTDWQTSPHVALRAQSWVNPRPSEDWPSVPGAAELVASDSGGNLVRLVLQPKSTTYPHGRLLLDGQQIYP